MRRWRVIRLPVLLTGFAALFLCAETARADLIAYRLQGIVERVNDPLLGIRLDDPLTGYFIYDSATLDVDPTRNGLYPQASPSSYRISVASYSVSGTDYTIAIRYSMATEYRVYYDYVFTAPGFGFTLNDADLLRSDALVTPFPETSFMTYLYGPGGPMDWTFFGRVTSITRVPEPASLLLLGTGLAVAGLVTRKRR